MKRILHIIGAMNRAGAETMLMNLYRELDKEKYQFDFLYFTEQKCDYDDEIISLGGKIYRATNSGFLKRFIATYHFFRANKQFYAIHSHTLLNNGANLFAAYLAAYKKRVSHSHSTANLIYLNTSQLIYYYVSKFLTNSFATHYIACSHDAANYLYYRKNKSLLLPNAVNFADFEAVKPEVRAELEIDLDTVLILQIGRFLDVKNHNFTIDLANFLHNSKKINFHIIFVGDGPLKSFCVQKVNDYNLSKQVTFLGLRSDIPSVLKSVDCMLLPSLHEGFPVVLVEAQVAGVPSLISDTISKDVDLGVDLIYFESLNSDFEKWEQQLLFIKNHKKTSNDYLEKLKQQGFDVKSSLSILIDFYENV
jgi:glycosyltransferase EpsF